MKTFVCGDTHGRHDIKKINRWYTSNFDLIEEGDVLIQLGDWGAIWYYPTDTLGHKRDRGLQVKYSKKKFQLLVVPGNHENYDLIEKLPIEERFGGKVRVLKPFNPYNPTKEYKEILLLERGEIYTINGLKYLALGGAMSQDKSMRTIGESWWEQELWTREQEDNCLKNLEEHNWSVDYVIAHTCPSDVGKILLRGMLNCGKVNDPVSKFFQFLINEGLLFNEWHFGHWHFDEKIEMYYGTFYCHYNKQPIELCVKEEGIDE